MNLTPAVGTLNAIRSNHKYGEIEGESRKFGECDFEYDKETTSIEPRDGVRGDIARVYLYMVHVKDVKLSKQQHERVKRWDREDPPSEWEKMRVARIHQLQNFTPAVLDSIEN